MQLFIMRHGPAEDSSPTGSDGDRVLTLGGRERVQSVAEELRKANEIPARILTSPLARALQTAEIVAREVLTTGRLEVRKELGAGAPPLALLAELQSQGGPRVMLVGHQPDLSEMIGDLTDQEVRMEVKKAMVVCLDWGAAKPAQLRFVLDPVSLNWQRYS